MHNVTTNGATIPALGLGTFRMPGEDVLRIVPYALKAGFRHVDTAQIYGNEAEDRHNQSSAWQGFHQRN
jgi:diketogulonate reductase-like aldo/keto reductase